MPRKVYIIWCFILISGFEHLDDEDFIKRKSLLSDLSSDSEDEQRVLKHLQRNERSASSYTSQTSKTKSNLSRPNLSPRNNSDLIGQEHLRYSKVQNVNSRNINEHGSVSSAPSDWENAQRQAETSPNLSAVYAEIAAINEKMKVFLFKVHVLSF